MGQWNYTYMLRCGDDTFYIGWTNDIKKRLAAHQNGQGAKYTRGRGPISLVYLEYYKTKEEAMRREAVLKRLTRAQKSELIQNNQDWRERYETDASI